MLFFTYLGEGVMGNPAHPAMAFFREYCIELLMKKQQGVMDVTTSGRHGDYKEFIQDAADHAWNLIQSGNGNVRTFNGFKTGLGRYKATMQLEEDAA